MLLTVDERSKRILVVRALQLGDLLCAVPALRCLRGLYPTAEITLCGLPWAKDFVQRFSKYLDKFISFPGYPGIPERQPIDFVALESLRFQSQRRPWDLILQLQGSGGYINDFVRELSAERTVGFHPASDPGIALESSIEWPESGHEIDRLKSLILSLGAADCEESLEFPIFEVERIRARELLSENGISLGEPYLCVHAGGRSRTRRWMTDRYHELIQRLVADSYKVVLTGVADEWDVQSGLNASSIANCISLFGKTTVGELAAVIEEARLLISNDTGASHIAAAVKTPSLIIVLGSEPARWFPKNHVLHSAISVPVDCRPCHFQLCPVGFPCATGLSVEDVYAAARNSLERTNSLCVSTLCASGN